MAVLHHAFRCPMTSETARDIARISAMWMDGDKDALSLTVIKAWRELENRQDIYAAFALDPEGPILSWLEPAYISPGLASLIVLAPGFIVLPNLSASHDVNHVLLKTHLPALGWTAEDAMLLINGRPIEKMLESFNSTQLPIVSGGLRQTGGWISGRDVARLRGRLDDLAQAYRRDINASEPLHRIVERNALGNAQAMLSGIAEPDWLVTAITH